MKKLIFIYILFLSINLNCSEGGAAAAAAAAPKPTKEEIDKEMKEMEEVKEIMSIFHDYKMYDKPFLDLLNDPINLNKNKIYSLQFPNRKKKDEIFRAFRKPETNRLTPEEYFVIVQFLINKAQEEFLAEANIIDKVKKIYALFRFVKYLPKLTMQQLIALREEILQNLRDFESTYIVGSIVDQNTKKYFIELWIESKSGDERGQLLIHWLYNIIEGKISEDVKNNFINQFKNFVQKNQKDIPIEYLLGIREIIDNFKQKGAEATIAILDQEQKDFQEYPTLAQLTAFKVPFLQIMRDPQKYLDKMGDFDENETEETKEPGYFEINIKGITYYIRPYDVYRKIIGKFLDNIISRRSSGKIDDLTTAQIVYELEQFIERNKSIDKETFREDLEKLDEYSPIFLNILKIPEKENKPFFELWKATKNNQERGELLLIVLNILKNINKDEFGFLINDLVEFLDKNINQIPNDIIAIVDKTFPERNDDQQESRAEFAGGAAAATTEEEGYKLESELEKLKL